MSNNPQSADAAAVVAMIASRLASLRRARDLSLQDIADRTGFAKSHIWEIENGRSRNPTIATAVGLARALGVSLDYLAGFSTSEPALHPDAMRIACEVDAILRRRNDASEVDRRARESLREHWAAFCDADPVPADFIEEMETAGFARLRKANLADMQDSFAEERGIYPGGDIWVLTDLGREVLRASAPASGEGAAA